jgi:hypothetical protein
MKNKINFLAQRRRYLRHKDAGGIYHEDLEGQEGIVDNMFNHEIH